MNKSELIKILEPLDDDAEIHVQVNMDLANPYNCLLDINSVSDVVTGDILQNEITLECW